MDGLSEAQYYGEELLGSLDIPFEEAACGMPVSRQVEWLERELATHTANGCTVQVTDLYALEGVERTVVLDAMVAGDPSPFVLVEGRLVCTGSVDPGAVLGALA